MASPQYLTTMEHLPGDVLSNIFVRLSAIQVARMRCVSKSWNTRLSQPFFIKSHLFRSIQNNELVLLVFKESFCLKNPFTAHPSRSPNVQLTNFIKFPVVSRPDFGASLLIGSINGLICYADTWDCYIWNPSLSLVLTIPEMDTCCVGSIEFSFRFGFDPINEDYKVLCLANSSVPDRTVLACWQTFQIYSMRRHSWKTTTQRFPSRVRYIIKQDEVCGDGHDGHLHWLGYINEDRKVQTIFTFDLSVETFHEIPPPDSLQQSNRENYLGVLEKKLCVMSSIEDGGIEVWVLMDRAAESWVKRYVFSQFSGTTIPFGFTLHNEFIFESFGDCRLSLYDPVARKVKRFKKRGKFVGLTKIVQYVDSLVWVAPANCDISGCDISRLQV